MLFVLHSMSLLSQVSWPTVLSLWLHLQLDLKTLTFLLCGIIKWSAGFLIPPHRTCIKCSARTRICIHKYCTNSSWITYHDCSKVIETAGNHCSWPVIWGYEVLEPSIRSVCLYACQTTGEMELAYSFSLIHKEFAVTIVQINFFPSINPYLEVVIFRWILYGID